MLNINSIIAALQLINIHCLVQEHFSWSEACQIELGHHLSFSCSAWMTFLISIPLCLLFQVLSAFQAQQNTAAVQPQLLIPLSSIPSYSAAMDTNPLLGTTYKKFPYPSMAEISSLAAQTQFTEEQIKVPLRIKLS